MLGGWTIDFTVDVREMLDRLSLDLRCIGHVSKSSERCGIYGGVTKMTSYTSKGRETGVGYGCDRCSLVSVSTCDRLPGHVR